MARRLLWASLALAPITILVDLLAHPNKTLLFVLAAVALIPLAWLIGESTEQAAEHTGARIGGLLNASFGNAPELIIALIAIADSLPNVVRGSLAGSIVSNVLLVLGAAVVIGEERELDRTSLWTQLGLIVGAAVLLLIPSIPGWHGNPDRHSLALLSIGPAVVLLAAYIVVTTIGLRGNQQPPPRPEASGWSLRAALGVLAAATVATAIVSEILVHSLQEFASALGLSQFFISIVIVAIVGNAAEHGGAIVIARRGNMNLATEIAVSSGAQVGLFVMPAIALLSFLFAHPLPLAFRPIELAAIAVSAPLVAIVVRDRCARTREGIVLIVVYALMAVGFAFAGDRGG